MTKLFAYRLIHSKSMFIYHFFRLHPFKMYSSVRNMQRDGKKWLRHDEYILWKNKCWNIKNKCWAKDTWAKMIHIYLIKCDNKKITFTLHQFLHLFSVTCHILNDFMSITTCFFAFYRGILSCFFVFFFAVTFFLYFCNGLWLTTNTCHTAYWWIGKRRAYK